MSLNVTHWVWQAEQSGKGLFVLLLTFQICPTLVNTHHYYLNKYVTSPSVFVYFTVYIMTLCGFVGQDACVLECLA